MKAKTLTLPIVWSLLVLAVAVHVGFAQMETQGTGGFRVAIKGKIDFSGQLGGYFLRGERPGGQFMIVNQNPTVLENFRQSMKTVVAKGTLRGSTYLTIRTIDGNPYSGSTAVQ
jgi:hypothetical protein